MLRIDCKFPGGNILVEDLEGDCLSVRPDLRDTTISWFYWAFRLRGAAGRHFHVRFTACRPVGMRGPAISTDGRRSWHWTTEPWDDDSFEISVPEGCDEIYLAMAPLYTQENWDRFVVTFPSLAPQGGYDLGFFATSRKGRPVELLHVGQPPAEADRLVVITARHHCCEMIASYVMEGVIAAILAGDTEEGRWLRDHASFTFVPFADKDGVEDGDPGKNRRPHDHNRDYIEFIYPETTAIAKLCTRLNKTYGVSAMIDLHCPWIRGKANDIVYQPGEPRPESQDAQIAFGTILEKSLPEGSLPYFQKDFYPFGQGWNTAGNYADGLCASEWSSRVCGIVFSGTVEIAYASASGVTVTADGARLFGKGMAIALARYFQQQGAPRSKAER